MRTGGTGQLWTTSPDTSVCSGPSSSFCARRSMILKMWSASSEAATGLRSSGSRRQRRSPLPLRARSRSSLAQDRIDRLTNLVCGAVLARTQRRKRLSDALLLVGSEQRSLVDCLHDVGPGGELAQLLWDVPAVPVQHSRSGHGRRVPRWIAAAVGADR